METEQAQIKDFMVNAQQVTPRSPTVPSIEVRIGRLKWLAEELCELANAWGVEIDLNNSGNTTGNFSGTALPPEKCQYSNPVDAITEAYDASLDLIVFSVGNGVAMGADLQPGWDEVHRSNMAKFGPGGYKRADGKWCKPPDWKKPDLRAIIEAQITKFENQASIPGT